MKRKAYNNKSNSFNSEYGISIHNTVLLSLKEYTQRFCLIDIYFYLVLLLISESDLTILQQLIQIN